MRGELEQGWSEDAKSFTQSFGSPDLDASNLIMAIVGFLPADDPRMVATCRSFGTPVRRWVTMEGRQPDDRSLLFAGDTDDDGRPLAMTVEILRARAARWPLSERTPEGVAELLARSRQMFVDGYYTYENFMDAATRSLQAVEAALRVPLKADEKASFASLIKRARAEGLVNDEAHDILDTGRRLRNRQIHATAQSVWTPALAAGVLHASHRLVADLYSESES